MSDHDLVIRGGSVADGTGAGLWQGDVAVKDGRIVATGTVSGSGKDEIDARGKLVTPGFVDIHTHYDAQVTWDTRFSPSTNHGVTTIVMGNCGVGFAPCAADMRDEMISVMEGVEDIPGIVLAEGLPWNWASFPEYMDAIEQRKMDADFAVAVPHIPVRIAAMGKRAIAREPATAEDMAAMAAIVAEGISVGAFGFSTTRVISHRSANGEQLPVTRASEDELMAIAMAMKPYGQQLFMSASEFDTTSGYSEEFQMLARIAEMSGHTVTFPLLQYNEAPDRWREIADACATERDHGVDIYGQVVGRPVGVLYGLELTLNPFTGCPTYDRIAHLSLDQKVAAMREPDVRAKILAEMDLPLDTATYPFFLRDTASCYAMGSDPEYAPPERKRFDRLAKKRGCSTAEIAYDAVLEEEGRAILYYPARNFSARNLDVVHDMLARDETVLGLGDGGAHVGSICDASMQTFMLTYWARDRKGARFPVEEVVRRMTRHTALVGGFGDRGLILPQFKADINIIDYDALALSAPHVSFDLPGGGRRLTQKARGYTATIVSGVATARDDQPTGALPGHLVRGRRAW